MISVLNNTNNDSDNNNINEIQMNDPAEDAQIIQEN